MKMVKRTVKLSGIKSPYPAVEKRRITNVLVKLLEMIRKESPNCKKINFTIDLGISIEDPLCQYDGNIGIEYDKL